MKSINTMKKITLFLFLLVGIVYQSAAEPTKLTIRAKAKDAKFIGSSIGGALVLVRSAMTDELLAKGITSGSTGNTTLIMKTAHERGKPLSDEKTAGFTATLDIEEPTLVTIEVTAPINQKQAAITATKQVWVIPGKDVLGDGIVVEVPGFVVDVLYPQTHSRISLASLEDGQLPLKANVVMMCGCPTSNGGIWDAEQYEVAAIVKKDGEKVGTVELAVEDQVNTFEGSWKADGGGLYEFTIYAFDPITGNSGVDKVNMIVSD